MVGMMAVQRRVLLLPLLLVGLVTAGGVGCGSSESATPPVAAAAGLREGPPDEEEVEQLLDLLAETPSDGEGEATWESLASRLGFGFQIVKFKLFFGKLFFFRFGFGQCLGQIFIKDILCFFQRTIFDSHYFSQHKLLHGVINAFFSDIKLLIEKTSVQLFQTLHCFVQFTLLNVVKQSF